MTEIKDDRRRGLHREWLGPIGLLLGSVALAAAPNASAQSADEEAEEIILAPIVIEGAKIERDFVDTPESVGVVTSQRLDELNVTDLKDSFQFLGNVRSFEANAGNNGFVIRGINSEGVTQPTNNAPVTSVIIDGATQSVESTRRGARGIWDVEQIEVFRGPQSTLQGRGALAGAVIIETKDPTFFYEAGAEFVGGQDDRRDAAFFVSGPLIADQVAARVSGEFRERDFDIDFNVPENEIIAEDRYRNLRGKILVEPERLPDLSLLLTGSFTYDKPGVRAVNSVDFFDREFNAAPTTAIEIREARNNNYVAELNYDLSDVLTLTSISSFIDSETEISTPSGINFSRDETRSGRDFTQDLRLQIGSSDDPFSGVVGGFFGRFTLPRDSLVLQNPLANNVVVVQDLTSDNKTNSYAAYADLRWEFVQDLSLLAGLRYQREEVTSKAKGVIRRNFNTLDTLDINETDVFHAWLPKIGLSYALTENQSISATAQRGFRSGFIDANNNDSISTVDPEFVWSYELGYRAQSPDGKWLLGVTGFYSDYTDQQIPVTVFEGGIPFTQTQNAGQSRSYGAEVEGQYQSDFGLNVFGSLGLLKTEFVDLETAGGDFSGNEFPEAPAVTASFGGVYTTDVGLFVAGDVVYTGSYFSSGSLSNDPKVEVDDSVEVGLSAGFEQENWKVTVYAENLLDEEIIRSLNNNNSFGARATEAVVADGRRVGIELKVNY